MNNLFCVAKRVSSQTSTDLVSVPCAVKCFFVAPVSSTATVVFKDGDLPSDEIRATLKIRAQAGGDTLMANDDEIFLFRKKVYVQVQDTAEPNPYVGVLLISNPVGP